MTDACTEACLEDSSSIKGIAPLVEGIVSQAHELPEQNDVRSAEQEPRSDREQAAKDKRRNVRHSAQKTF